MAMGVLAALAGLVDFTGNRRVRGETRMTAPATVLPGGPINHHWTKSLAASPDGARLHVGIGSNGDIAEHGIEAERGRVAVWEIDRTTGAHRPSPRAYPTRPALPSSRNPRGSGRSVTGFLNDRGEARGHPVRVTLDRSGALLVADDADDTVRRVAARTGG